ncbi:MAG: amidophosphoribosyltransferase [Porticoccaceae bacterium]|jgi:amidophosphoribosyltransferase|nr:amidophosphoribosyltransferase [Porticoccaceae bacterium]MBT5578185.1 amidophosphoribosyltransferase [Porticoccaceae bacterium]MBT7375728.1 amidophosphoribosyltransferase [Porticoccaceae bacterium]
MCGVVGISGSSDVNLRLYDALTMLQHRGQDAAGIVTEADGELHQCKGEGLARDVFRQSHMERLVGNVGIGHVRYPTAGSSGPALAQPLYVNSPYGICIAHNGNLTNADELRGHIFRADLRHLNTDSDSEVLLNVFAHELQLRGKLEPSSKDIFAAVEQVHKRCRGAYAVVGLIANYGMFAFRDPHGIRPLCYGVRETAAGKEYAVVSESVVLDNLGFELIRDLAPGEALFVDKAGEVHLQQCAAESELVPCIFEHVYFARPDSLMDNISVYKCRLRMGEKLAEKLLRLKPDHDIDVVIPIPDTSRVSAQAMAERLGVKLREGFMKNRYIGRTFIMPGQTERKKSVRQKLNAVKLEFAGKNVLLIDDSIVRGTTSQEIIQMARDAGAKNVYMASAAPGVRYPNVYGIDMPSATELIAHGRTDDEVGEIIGADWIIYQDLEDLISSAAEGNEDINRFECSVFDGNYITGDVDKTYLDRIEGLRNDAAKQKSDPSAKSKTGQVIGIHNNSVS